MIFNIWFVQLLARLVADSLALCFVIREPGNACARGSLVCTGVRRPVMRAIISVQGSRKNKVGVVANCQSQRMYVEQLCKLNNTPYLVCELCQHHSAFSQVRNYNLSGTGTPSHDQKLLYVGNFIPVYSQSWSL